MVSILSLHYQLLNDCSGFHDTINDFDPDTNSNLMRVTQSCKEYNITLCNDDINAFGTGTWIILSNIRSAKNIIAQPHQ